MMMMILRRENDDIIYYIIYYYMTDEMRFCFFLRESSFSSAWQDYQFH